MTETRIAVPAFRRFAAALPLLAVIAWACDGKDPVDPDPDPDPVPAPTAIEVGLGNFQHGVVGVTLSQPVVFAVYDDTGGVAIPVPGVPVTIEVQSGGGSIAGGPFVTDDEGLVSATWTLGTTTGVQSLRAFIPLDTVLATATAHASAPVAIEKIGGEAQAGTAGSTLGDSLRVRVVDAHGNGVQNVVVEWSASDGGSLTPDPGTTDENGLVEAAWQLGATIGEQTATASVGAISTSFTATAGPSNAPTVRIEFERDTVQLTHAGDTAHLHAVGYDAAGIVTTSSATWRSEDTVVARVSGDGIVSARNQGLVQIHATIGAVTDSVEAHLDIIGTERRFRLMPEGAANVFPTDDPRLVGDYFITRTVAATYVHRLSDRTEVWTTGNGTGATDIGSDWAVVQADVGGQSVILAYSLDGDSVVTLTPDSAHQQFRNPATWGPWIAYEQGLIDPNHGFRAGVVLATNMDTGETLTVHETTPRAELLPLPLCAGHPILADSFIAILSTTHGIYSLDGALVAAMDQFASTREIDVEPSRFAIIGRHVYAYTRDLPNGTLVQRSDRAASCPVLDGLEMVWSSDASNGNADIFLHDLVTGQTRQVTATFDSSERAPSFDGGRILWADGGWFHLFESF